MNSQKAQEVNRKPGFTRHCLVRMTVTVTTRKWENAWMTAFHLKKTSTDLQDALFRVIAYIFAVLQHSGRLHKVYKVHEKNKWIHTHTVRTGTHAFGILPSKALKAPDQSVASETLRLQTPIVQPHWTEAWLFHKHSS